MYFLRSLRYRTHIAPGDILNRFGWQGERRAIEADMRRCLTRYGLYYEEYMLYECVHKSEAEKAALITELGRYDILRRVNRYRDLSLFHDKRRVYERYAAHYGREVLFLEQKKDREAFLAFGQKHGTVFVKPVDRSCGSGVRRITVSPHPAEAEKQFAALIPDFPLLCEEEVTQHPAMAEWNPSSLNTVRLVTVLTETGVRPFRPFLRIGRSGSAVDNLGAGGIVVSVDAADGTLAAFGRDENGRYYREHPDTHVPFAGKRLPDWDKALTLAERLARICPTSRCIGWDLALSEHGWIMIEANCRGQFVGQQIGDRVGRKEELLALCASARRLGRR